MRFVDEFRDRDKAVALAVRIAELLSLIHISGVVAPASTPRVRLISSNRPEAPLM